MDIENEVRDFPVLAARPAHPDLAGCPRGGGNRRVKGLRREEVAMLAGVSVGYVRLERGNLGGVSEAVLDSLANALQLDEAERSHLHDLARAASLRKPVRRRARVRPAVQWLLDSMDGTAATSATPAPTCWRPTTLAERCTPRSRDARTPERRPLRLPRPASPGVLRRVGEGDRRSGGAASTLAGENPMTMGSPSGG